MERLYEVNLSVINCNFSFFEMQQINVKKNLNRVD